MQYDKAVATARPEPNVLKTLTYYSFQHFF